LNFENQRVYNASQAGGKHYLQSDKMKVTQLLSTFLIAIAIGPQAAAKVQPKQLTQSQLRQFVHCLLRAEVITKKYGPNLRFRYMLLPPYNEAEEGVISAVLYRSRTLKMGMIIAFAFRGKKCMEFEEGNYAPLISIHGKPDLDADSMGNGGIGTYNEFMKQLRRLQKKPLLEMDISHLPRSCERCLSYQDQNNGDSFSWDVKKGTLYRYDSEPYVAPLGLALSFLYLPRACTLG
jgi:hypothetical protein